MSWKPDGYTIVSPYLIVPDVDDVLAFLENVFAAERLRRYDDDKGGVVHAEARVGDSVLMLAQANESWPATTSNLHVYVRDVDEVYARALSAGAEAVQEPRRNDGDPDRRGGVRGPGGNNWWIATQQE